MNKDPFTAKPPTDRYLARAAWIGSLEAASTWAARAINIDAPAAGRTPLQWAISRGHKDIVNLLLKKGADITLKTEEGDNALACAVWSGNAGMVQLMIDKGFDPTEKATHGKSALDWAEVGGKPEIIQLVKKRMIDITRTRTAAQQSKLKAHRGQNRFRLGF